MVRGASQFCATQGHLEDVCHRDVAAKETVQEEGLEGVRVSRWG